MEPEIESGLGEGEGGALKSLGALLHSKVTAIEAVDDLYMLPWEAVLSIGHNPLHACITFRWHMDHIRNYAMIPMLILSTLHLYIQTIRSMQKWHSIVESMC